MLHRRTRESQACKTLREAALRYPDATQHEPWDHYAIKVRAKTFVFLADGEEGFSVSCKLTGLRAEAKTLPFAEPTGYGLGRSGWMTASFPEPADAPIALLLQWIDESYRVIAPKKLVAVLDGGGAGAAGQAKAPVRGAAAGRRVRRKTKR
jgi:predicted DNA-binding protein (MmcQ/YjbR family)